MLCCVGALLLAAAGVPALSPPVQPEEGESLLNDTVEGASDELGLSSYERNLTVHDPRELEGLDGLTRDLRYTGDVEVGGPEDLHANATSGNVTVEGAVIVSNPGEWTEDDLDDLPESVHVEDLRVPPGVDRSALPTVESDATPATDGPTPPGGTDGGTGTDGETGPDPPGAETPGTDDPGTDDPVTGTTDGQPPGSDDPGGATPGADPGSEAPGTDGPGAGDPSGESDPPVESVSVSVSAEDGSITDASVSVDGDPVTPSGAEGSTGSGDGDLEVTLDARESLGSTTAEVAGSGLATSVGSRLADAVDPTSDTTVPSVLDDLGPAAVAAGAVAGLAGGATAESVANEAGSPDRQTGADVTVAGDRIEGAVASVSATVDGDPLTDATVRVDGAAVATTDASGTASIRLPAGDRARITVERGTAGGVSTVALTPVNLSIDAAPISLPGRSASVEVTADGEPLADRTVTVDGEAVATTDENGTATISVPPSRGATIGVGEEPRVAQQRLHPIRNAGLLLVVAVLGIAGLVLTLRWLTRRWGIALRTVPRRVWRRTIGDRLRRPGDPRRLVPSVTLDPIGRCRRTGAWLRSAPRRLAWAVWWLTALPRWLAAGLLGVGGTSSGAGGAADPATGTEPAGAAPAAGATDGRPGLIRSAWRWLVGTLSVSRPTTRTPAELARTAVEAGYPADAVETVLAAYREVQYGDRAPEEAVGERVERAVERVEESGGDGE